MRWTKEQYDRYVQRRLKAECRSPVLDDQGEIPSAIVEQTAGDKPLAAKKGANPVPPRLRVRVTSRRSRLLDPDNLAAKYLIDCLRYAGVLPNDTAADIDLEVRQEKVGKDQEETVVEIWPLTFTP